MAQSDREYNKRREAYLNRVFGKRESDFCSCVGGYDSNKCCCRNNRIEAALKYAHEIRQFEIRLYWQRALYFWGFMTVLLAGYGLLITQKPLLDTNLAALGVAGIGFFISFVWRYVEKGAKNWQANWEFHIDFLEDSVTGKLHKTVIGEDGNFFSVSGSNSKIIVAICILWFGAIFLAFVRIIQCAIDKFGLPSCWMIVAMIVASIIIVLFSVQINVIKIFTDYLPQNHLYTGDDTLKNGKRDGKKRISTRALKYFPPRKDPPKKS